MAEGDAKYDEYKAKAELALKELGDGASIAKIEYDEQRKWLQIDVENGTCPMHKKEHTNGGNPRHPPCLALPWWMSREDRYTYNWLSLFLL